MYKETIDALNANIRKLAGGGLRATVEAICLNKNIKDGHLQNKIDELVKQQLLTTTQADLLHEERYILKSGVKMTIFRKVVGGNDESNTCLRSEPNVMA